MTHLQLLHEPSGFWYVWERGPTLGSGVTRAQGSRELCEAVIEDDLLGDGAAVAAFTASEQAKRRLLRCKK